MLLRDVVIGMKVVIKSKTGRFPLSDISAYTGNDPKSPLQTFHSKNGFGYVMEVEHGNVIVGASRDRSSGIGGDYFDARDLVPFGDTELIGDNRFDKGTKYGVVGTLTDMTYRDGSSAHVGDVVRIEGVSELANVIHHEMDGYTIMGIAGTAVGMKDGVTKNGRWRVSLVEKFDSPTIKDGFRGIKRVPMNPPVVKKSKPKTEPAPKIKETPVLKIYDAPQVVETKDSVVVYNAPYTYYFNKELGLFGKATCVSPDVYDKKIGLAIAYYNAHNEVK
jgi:hypothetical protein